MSIRFKLYESNGITERYTFSLVQETNAPNNPEKFTEVRGFRGQGSLVITGSEAAWDLIIRGLFNQDNYDDITTAIDALETALAFGEPYYLKIDKDLAQTSQYSYKIKRIVSIVYPNGLRNGKGFQEYSVTLRVNSW